MSNPKPLQSSSLTPPSLIFTDIDDTLTLNGKLPPETFMALARLREAGIPVIPVTGASCGWCDCIVRTWPVDTVIGENGALIITNRERYRIEYINGAEARKEYAERLSLLASRVMEAVPGARLSHDTMYRVSEIAFDVGQDQVLDRDRCLEIIEICQQAGATARMSSIHINVWFGDHTKATTAARLLQELAVPADRCLFIGDSMNDEDMFRLIETSVGVANIKPFLGRLEHKPTYITTRPGGLGFVEFAEAILH